jgi:DNA-binding transcriptional regulator YiaG
MNASTNQFPTGLMVALKRSRISQRTVALMLGRGQATISRWCAGCGHPDDESLAMLSALLGVAPEVLAAPARLDGEGKHGR